MEKKSTKKLYDGDSLTDIELVNLIERYEIISVLLSGLGEEFKPFLIEALTKHDMIAGFLQSRNVCFQPTNTPRRIGVAMKTQWFLRNQNNEFIYEESDREEIISLFKDISSIAVKLDERFVSLVVYVDYLINKIKK